MPISSCFRIPPTSKRVHVSQTLLEPALNHFNLSFPLIEEKLSLKISPLVRSEILRLLGNTLGVDHMYCRHRWEKLRQKFETLFPPKRRTISGIFIGVLESTKNLADFEKKDQLHSLNISKVIDLDKCGYFNARKLLF